MSPSCLVVRILTPTAIANASAVDVPDFARNAGQHPFTELLKVHLTIGFILHILADVEIRILFRFGEVASAVVAIITVGIIQNLLILSGEVVVVRIITQEAAIASIHDVSRNLMPCNTDGVVFQCHLRAGVGKALRADRLEVVAPHPEETLQLAVHSFLVTASFIQITHIKPRVAVEDNDVFLIKAQRRARSRLRIIQPCVILGVTLWI